MSITITTVERLGQVAADPALVALSGFLYTKDDPITPGTTQLFFKTDNAGTVYQLTPTGGAGTTPWQRTGTVVALDQTGDTEVNPFDDNSTDFGISTKRWLNVRTGSNGLSCFNTSGDTNRSAFFGGAGLSFGPGGATALDVGLTRVAAGELAVNTGDGGASGTLLPLVDATGTLGKSATRWRSVNTGTAGHNVFAVAGDTFATSSLLSATLKFGAGGASAQDVGLLRAAVSANTIEVSDGGSASGSLQPLVTNTGTLGTSGATGKTWASVKTGQGGHSVYAVSTEANAQSILTGNASGGSVQLGAGGATGLDTRIQRTAAVTLTIDDNGTATGRVDVLPGIAATTNADGMIIGASNKKLSNIWTIEINTGDIIFNDETCPLCHKQFQEGDDLVMRVIKIHDDPGGRRARTIPAHHGCK